VAQFDGLNIWPWGKERFVEELLKRAREGIPTLACYLNAHTYNLSCNDRDYRTVLSQADILYPDGISIVWGVRWLCGARTERMTGVDFFEDFVRRAEETGIRVYFLGGKPGVVERMSEALRRKYPAIAIAGMRNGFFRNEDPYVTEIITDINTSRVDVLLVGLGSPAQERFAWNYRQRLNVPVVWTVGALFDYWGGQERAAPRWLANLGFEWLWRLGRDPRNKWRRYLLGNWAFMYRAGRLIVRKRFAGVKDNGSLDSRKDGGETGPTVE